MCPALPDAFRQENGRAFLVNLTAPCPTSGLLVIIQEKKVAIAPSELVAITRALASCVGSDLEPVPTQLHAAPTSGPLLACVVKVQHALSTLADTVAIHTGEQHCHTICQRGKQVFRATRIEPQLRSRCAATRLQPGEHRMLCH